MSADLIADNIAKSYPTPAEPLVVLRDISLHLRPGDCAAIMGPSGSGKSTLLNILGTLEPPTSGTLRLGDVNPLSLDERELAVFRNGRIGFIFQEHHLLPHCTALENVLVPTLVRSDGDAPLDRARDLLARVGLAGRLEHRPAELSGGERQRVAVARALVTRPALVLADEPTGNLDSASARAVTELLAGLASDEGAILVFVTHSVELAALMRLRFELHDGRLAPADAR